MEIRKDPSPYLSTFTYPSDDHHLEQFRIFWDELLQEIEGVEDVPILRDLVICNLVDDTNQTGDWFLLSAS